MYVIMEILISGVRHSLFMKMDSSLSVLWELSFNEPSNIDQVKITQDKSTLVFSLEDPSTCKVGKVNTSNGSLSLLKVINSADNCKRTVLNSVETKVYVSGFIGVVPHMFVLNFADLSVLSVFEISMSSIESIATFGSDSNSNRLLVNSFLMTTDTKVTTAVINLD